MIQYQPDCQPEHRNGLEPVMASNDLLELLAMGAPSVGTGARSMLDERLRTILMRYLLSLPDPSLSEVWSKQHLLRQQFNNLMPMLEPDEFIESVWSTMLERERSDVASLARFAHRVDYATFHFCAAFEKAEVRDFQLSRPR